MYIFLALVMMSSVLFAQTKQLAVGNLSAIKITKSINTLPAGSKAVVDSLRYDGDNADGIGTNTSASTFEVAAFFSAAQLAAHNALGNTITSVKVYVNGITTVTTATIKIYSDQGITSVRSQAFTPIEGWNNVILTTPLPIPTTDLYIGYELVTTGGFPAGCDAGPAIPNGNWIKFNGTWQHLTALSASLVYNWNIRAMVSGTALTIPVATCSPLTWAAGNVATSTTATSGTFTLTNTGGGTLTASTITGVSAPFTCTLVPSSVTLTGGQATTFTFSYAPTTAVLTSQTAVITTNGGVISITLSGTGIACSTINTFPWIESFEGAFPPACWNKENLDGGTGWDAITVGTTPLPGWQGGVMTTPTGGGNAAAYCTWTTGGTASNDQWLVTPKIAVVAGQGLLFQLLWFGTYQDFLAVKVSTTTNAAASFTTTIATVDTSMLVQGAWNPVVVDLSAYAGQSVYFAFNEYVADNVNDGAFFGLDLVTVDQVSGMNTVAQDIVSVFPNPANNKLYIGANNLKSVEIYNLTGMMVAKYNQNVINISELAQGTYIVKVITDSKVITKKINVVR